MSSFFLRRLLVYDVFHLWMLGKINALLVKPFSADLFQEDLQDFVDALMLFYQFLVLASALDGIPRL
jgi:hypothetical protein